MTETRWPRYWDEEIETMSRPELRELQLKLLQQTIDFAYRNSPYYTGAFDQIGVKPDDLKGLDDLKRFPFMHKTTLRERQEAHQPLGDVTAVPEEKIVYISVSSGSTGVPTASPFTAQDWDAWIDYEARLFWSSGMRPTDRYCHALNFSLFVGGPCVLGAQKLGALCIHAGTMPSERLLTLMRQFGATITWTTPSYAWYLGETAQNQGIDPAQDLGIRKIFVAGEPGGSIPVTRSRIEELWDAEVYDYYGLSDIFGACAGECEARSGLHFAEDHIFVEVLDPDTGEEVKEGERGELVMTTLKKFARPLVRFRSGDIVSYTTERCSCGRTHLRLQGIHGRLDDMLIIRGVNVFPSDIERVARDNPNLTGEYRLVVDRVQHLDVLTVEVEHKPGYQGTLEHLEKQLTEQIRSILGIKTKLVVLPPEALPRATHKAKRVIDKREHVWE